MEKRYQTIFQILGIIILLLPIFLTACSGKLGKIEVEDVDTQLLAAEKAIESAREVNAHSLAFEEFEQAETFLDQAKEAKKQNNGINSLLFSSQAITYAKIAHRKALYNSINAEYNATILQKDALIVELRKDINSKKTEISGLQTGVDQLRNTENQLQQTIESMKNERQQLINTRNIHEQKVSELNESIKSIQSRLGQSESEIRNYGIQVKDLSRKLEIADNIAESASKQKRAAVAEVDSLKKQIREQAKTYTDMIEKASKQNVAEKHQEYLKKTAEQARAFANQLPSNKSPRTRRTSLSTVQINAGKAALNRWENEWKNKNLEAHLAFYLPDINANKIRIVESKENQTILNRTQIEKEIREMNGQSWQKIQNFTEVEQESVIGTYRYRRLVSKAQNEDDTTLYDMWTREIWMHQVQGNWKIYRETWQIYPNIPDYKE